MAGTRSKDANRGERVKIQKGAEPSESGDKGLNNWGVQCNCSFREIHGNTLHRIHTNPNLSIRNICNITLLGACFPRNPESLMRMGSDDFHSVDNCVLFFFDVFLWVSLGLLRVVKRA